VDYFSIAGKTLFESTGVFINGIILPSHEARECIGEKYD